LLPKDWPGRAARRLCGEIYRALLPASEQWLDRHGSNGTGPLPTAAAELRQRFADR
jgi:phenylacetic acid degradation operon negative regulatory protein